MEWICSTCVITASEMQNLKPSGKHNLNTSINHREQASNYEIISLNFRSEMVQTSK